MLIGAPDGRDRPVRHCFDTGPLPPRPCPAASILAVHVIRWCRGGRTMRKMRILALGGVVAAAAAAVAIAAPGAPYRTEQLAVAVPAGFAAWDSDKIDPHGRRLREYEAGRRHPV